jgi:hypothetical protein
MTEENGVGNLRCLVCLFLEQATKRSMGEHKLASEFSHVLTFYSPCISTESSKFTNNKNVREIAAQIEMNAQYTYKY